MIARRLFGAKPLSEQMLAYCLIRPLVKKILWNSNHESIRSRKRIWKCRLQNVCILCLPQCVKYVIDTITWSLFSGSGVETWQISKWSILKIRASYGVCNEYIGTNELHYNATKLYLVCPTVSAGCLVYRFWLIPWNATNMAPFIFCSYWDRFSALG